ncbi:diguanylate cyclase/phosphodiesterase [Nitrosospira multiformis]|uniref:Diguanylate cyclase/phosphodiesterase n=1 Tax=Nitrosospira multiformis TaxID=1231 RepID=A0A1I0CSF4_9PROT|nr:EAL domain-containing protein [Nitrosospira multiformis]SET21994.1 diguanylate cyclase/phosphodiesterase [Nitrosospira multiformis]
MSLFRQLWLAVILVTITSFTGSLFVSLLGTRSYLEQQLHRKNIDSANSLAYSISQLRKDPITIGLQIAAFFDSGQYQAISITSADGKLITERVQNKIETTVPGWFIRLFPISAAPGQAQISDALLHFGVIKVVSQAQLAYQALWEQAKTLMLWFLGAAIVCVLIGAMILQRIHKPLAEMVEQADEIIERRFLTISEPCIPELRSLARAINDMIRRLHNRGIEETKRLEALHKRINFDPVTGLARREHFMNQLSQILIGREEGHEIEQKSAAASEAARETVQDGAREGEYHPMGEHGEVVLHEEKTLASIATVADTATGQIQGRRGIFFLIRINNLEEINRKLGRAGANELLHRVGSLIGGITGEFEEITSSPPLAARLNGSDFALLAPDIRNAAKFARRLSEELSALPLRDGDKITDFCHIGAVPYQRGDTLSELLSRADAALATAEQTGANAWHLAAPSSRQASPVSLNISDWRHIFSDALTANRFVLAFYPVIDPTGAVLHQEGVARMQAQPEGGWLEASDFISIAARLNITGPIDVAVLRHALEFLQSNTGEVAVDLSIETVANHRFRNKLDALLRPHPELCRRLWIEVSEYGAFRKFEAFRDFCHIFRQLGCHVGIKDFARHLDSIQSLAGAGLSYLKVTDRFIHRINQNKTNQKFLKNLCEQAHALGMKVIALGVQNEAERKALIKLGFDGLSGRAIK